MSEFEREVARAVNPTLVEYRLGQVEDHVKELEKRMEQLATKSDVREIKTKLDEAATVKEQRVFGWWNTILGGAAAGTIVAIATAAVAKIH